MTAVAAATTAAVLLLAGCATDDPAATGPGTASQTTGSGTGSQSKFFVQADYDKELALLGATPTGPADRPWEQALNPTTVDTAKFRKPGPYKLCFSNAGLNNPWRQVGFKTMQAEVETHGSTIREFVHVDAEGKDQKQIADINDLLGRAATRSSSRRTRPPRSHPRSPPPARRGFRSSCSTAASTRRAR